MYDREQREREEAAAWEQHERDMEAREDDAWERFMDGLNALLAEAWPDYMDEWYEYAEERGLM